MASSEQPTTGPTWPPEQIISGVYAALMLAEHCRSKGREDMDIVPDHGIGRALITALDQLAKNAHHPELACSKLIMLGFSGAGFL